MWISVFQHGKLTTKTTNMKWFVKLDEYSNHELTWENTKRRKTLLQVHESALSWMISCNTPQVLYTEDVSS